MISLINLTKRFGSLTAVNNVSLKIQTGEIFGFLGPNGAGKTTTIKMIAGILEPTQGNIIIDGFTKSSLALSFSSLWHRFTAWMAVVRKQE